MYLFAQVFWFLLALWLAAAGKLPPAPRPAADFQVTADDWMKEQLADPKAFRAKYYRKTVEITGRIHRVDDSGNYPSLSFEGVIRANGFPSTPLFVPSAAARQRFDGLKALAKGQRLAVRGVCNGYECVERGEIVAAGPSTAVPMTVAGLKAALATEAGHKRLADKEVVVRGLVVTARPAKPDAGVWFWTLADPGAGDDAPRVTISKEVPPRGRFRDELRAALAPGRVVVVIGEVFPVRFDDGPHLHQSRVLKNPPAGVTLPVPGK